jgi:hypothetical protein
VESISHNKSEACVHKQVKFPMEKVFVKNRAKREVLRDKNSDIREIAHKI